MSAAISPVGTHVVAKEPDNKCSRMKWYHTSMCLEREDKEREFAMFKVLWLSQRSGKGCGRGIFKVMSKRRNQITSFMACTRVMYSTVESREGMQWVGRTWNELDAR